MKIGRDISSFSTYSCQPNTKNELEYIIDSRVSKHGPKCDLNDIDVSLVTDMSWLFSDLDFTGDISKWDVSRVKTMHGMFYNSSFNGNINDWDVSNVLDVIKTIYFIENHFKSKTVNFASFAHISMHKF